MLARKKRREMPYQKTIVVLCLLAFLFAFPAYAYDNSVTGKQIVILLHGHSRTSKSLRKMEKALLREGYIVENIDYPSRKMNIEDLSEYLDRKLKSCCTDKDKKLHFVTHSLGGIIVRFYLEKHETDNLGRVVMLSPPNSGSEIVDLLKDIPIVNEHTSKSRIQLGTGEESIPKQFGPVNYDLGVIAGDRSYIPLFSWIIPGPDDGMVSVQSAQAKGMSDFIVVPHTHTFIMNSQKVIEQVITFIENGEFAH